MTSSALVRPLFEGPLDIIGDVHGEIDALRSLLAALGYNANGSHSGGRRLVFVGDLCDRGPDSPAVIELVKGLVERELAQCVLGNHELNILRGDAKHGNHWFFDPDHEEQHDEFAHSKPAREQSLKQVWISFFRSLPVALERADLRVVHAAWQQEALEVLRRCEGDASDAFERYENDAHRHLAQTIAEVANAEKRGYANALRDRLQRPPLLENLGRYDEKKQNMNPLRVATSGVERLAKTPFWANGKWRMCDRVAWWNEYTDATSVIFGHYWRGSTESDEDVSGGKPDLFNAYEPNQWAGPNGNVFCVDFSVGGRYRERRRDVAS